MYTPIFGTALLPTVKCSSYCHLHIQDRTKSFLRPHHINTLCLSSARTFIRCSCRRMRFRLMSNSFSSFSSEVHINLRAHGSGFSLWYDIALAYNDILHSRVLPASWEKTHTIINDPLSLKWTFYLPDLTINTNPYQINVSVISKEYVSRTYSRLRASKPVRRVPLAGSFPWHTVIHNYSFYTTTTLSFVKADPASSPANPPKQRFFSLPLRITHFYPKSHSVHRQFR